MRIAHKNFNFSLHRLKNGAFTLIELLVVIAIIGLLASIVIVNVNSARDKAKTAKAVAFGQQIYRTIGSEAVGYWDFNQIIGSATPYTIKDLTNNGNTGILGNGACAPGAGSCPSAIAGLTFSGGNLGNALYFDGTDDYVNCGNSSLFNIASAITIEAWVRPSTLNPGSWNRIAEKFSCDWSTFWHGWRLSISGTDGKIGWEWSDGSYPWTGVSSNSALNLNVWTHVVVQINGNIGSIYINGQLDKQEDRGKSLSATSATLYLNGPWGERLNGALDEVRIYAKALSSAEIQQHYAEGLPGHFASVE
jgi:prepilin-type N-terminal cleavage/methylation domain-containing protein